MSYRSGGGESRAGSGFFKKVGTTFVPLRGDAKDFPVWIIRLGAVAHKNGCVFSFQQEKPYVPGCSRCVYCDTSTKLDVEHD